MIGCTPLKPEQSIVDVLFPKVRAELLRLFFAAPPKQRYVRELRNKTGLALSTVQDELRKLTAVGLLTTWSNGYHRFYRANHNHPLFAELSRIVQMSARLAKTKHSVLHPPWRTRKRKRARAARPLPPDRPLKWHLFSNSK